MPQVKIERLGQKGDGIAPGPVFVPRTLPGEIVEGEIVEGVLLRPRIVEPSIERKSPPCRHYRTCGGCGLQHASDAVAAEFKTDIVRAALAAHGIDAEVSLIHASPPQSRRRATLSGRRTKSGAIVGFHAPQSEILTPIPDCQVLRPSITQALPWFEAFTKRFGSRRAEMRFAVTETLPGLDLNIEGPSFLSQADVADATDLARKAGLARLSCNGERLATFSEPRVSFDGIEVTLPVGGFLQATAEAEMALRDTVLRHLDAVDGQVADLFAGAGTFALPMARRNEVSAFESDARALEALDHGWRHARSLRKITATARDLYRQPLLADELNRFSAVVLDPPRAGAAAQITEIANSSLTLVVYVSCSPKTFARDAATLVSAGFRPGSVGVVDQFRWSHHAELIAAFRR